MDRDAAFSEYAAARWRVLVRAGVLLGCDVAEAEDLAQDFENIANELRSQYSILFRPEPLKQDGLYHSVQVKVKSRKDLVVRARRGYYADKQ